MLQDETVVCDFTKVTRASRVALTTIRIEPYAKPSLIIRAGRSSLMSDDAAQQYWRLTARAKEGVTDFEHDCAYIFQVPVFNPVIEFVENSTVFINAVFLGRSAEDLRLKLDSKYDPTKLANTSYCDGDCGLKRHPIIPADAWAGPPPDPLLYQQLIGAKVSITMVAGPQHRKK